MASAPQYFDYSIPPSPTFPPVPGVTPASSSSSLHSLYELDGQRLQASFQYLEASFGRYESHAESPRERVLSISSETGAMFTDDELSKAFKTSSHSESLHGSPNRTVLTHEASEPSSPWKRSIRVRYSELNMRDSNTSALREAADLLSRDMASYVLSIPILV
jgi:hypothetical protein